ncbi:OmpP1/FadL family transporter [Adhaeribacter pallidiroseus]|uniref:Uncharacterized protein n=1 Tax=Adhaeribacter pallidiroseus TaxID=2072847 RepID=A0A369QT66_9BACT|nr:hypothetical protein [Adhaeribacter pallidiroseus]RDC65358.1 hypothetical protein AHMF7616_03988 [Adhaeribacter pallidiroseus]
MNQYKFLIAGLVFLSWTGEVSAQTEVDALRYSRTDFGGSARIQGMAGAQTALGADISTLSGNPAGLGLYRRSEISFSPGISLSGTESKLNNNSSATDQRNIINIPSLGIVFTKRKADTDESDWRSGAFGIGLTRLNNFQNRFRYGGSVNQTESLVQSLGETAIANQRTEADLDAEYDNGIETLEGLAYSTYLIGVNKIPTEPNNPNSPIREEIYVESQGNLTQNETVTSKGAQNQWDFSYGASYRDKLYLGASVGLTTVRYNQARVYQEVDADPTTDFQNLTLSDEFTTTGSGVNLKVGVIVRPVDAVRIGVSVQTPTFYTLRDQYTTSMATTFGGSAPGNYDKSLTPGDFEYTLTTPLRANGGVAFFAGKNGFISADVEYVNYGGARLGNNDGADTFSGTNDIIKDTYQSALNFRVGGEYRYNIFRLRAGYALYGDPYKSSAYDRDKRYLTAGVGIKQENTFFDIAVVNFRYNSVYAPYSLLDNLQPVVSTKNTTNSVLFTVGFNF